MSQNKIFTEGEGDAWFNRNLNHIQDIEQVVKSPDVRYALDTLTPFSGRINRVLEIGCSNGIKLEAICQHLNAVGVGVEPSPVAVKNGNERRTVADITLAVGTGDKLPPPPCVGMHHSILFILPFASICLIVIR